MLNAHTQKLLSYWRRLRGERSVPRKDEIDPRAIKDHLAYSFLIERHGSDNFLFRLAGTGLCELFGQELKGHNFTHYWANEARSAARTALTRVAHLAVPTVAVCVAETADLKHIRCEMILVPFEGERGEGPMMLGHLQPLEPLARLAGKKIVRLRMTASAILTGDAHSASELAFEERQRDAKAASHLKVVASR
jgi:hypothetical protein